MAGCMKILAYDPGKTSGLAEYDTETDDWRAWALPWFESCDYVVGRVFERWPDLVVCENFTISQRTLTQGADHKWPTGGIGVADWACRKAGIPFEKQSPGDAKQLVSDAVLRNMKWKTKGVDHPDDATRHLILALVRHRAIDLSRLR